MAAHRRGVALPDQMKDRDAARRGGIRVHVDHDHGEKYDGEAACFPEGWDTDDTRHVGEGANPCWGLAVEVLVSHACRGCHRSFHGASEDAVRRQVLEHQGRAS